MARVAQLRREAVDPYYPDLRPLTHAQRDYLAAFDAYLMAPRCSTEEDDALEAMTARLAAVLRHDRSVRFAGMSLGRTDVEAEVMQELLTNRERETLRRYQGGMSAGRIAQLYAHDYPGGRQEVEAKVGDMKQRVERGVTRVRQGLPAGATEVEKAQQPSVLPPMGATRAGGGSVTPLRPRSEPAPIEPVRRPDMAAAKRGGSHVNAEKAAARDRTILAWMRDNARRCPSGRWGDALEIPQGSLKSITDRLLSRGCVRVVKADRPREYEITDEGLAFAAGGTLPSPDCSGAVSRALPPAADERPADADQRGAPEQTPEAVLQSAPQPEPEEPPVVQPAPQALPERVLVQEPIEAGEAIALGTGANGELHVAVSAQLWQLLLAGRDWSDEKTGRFVRATRELHDVLAS